ncbi:MAG: hypothetical protein AAF430_18380 [Myxococcota bacterium]
MPAYDGPPRSDAEVGVIRIIGKGQFLEIDGIKRDGRAFKVLPGRRSLRFKFWFDDFIGDRPNRRTLRCVTDIRVAAGQEYEIVRGALGKETYEKAGPYTLSSREFEIWVANARSGARIDESVVFCDWS